MKIISIMLILLSGYLAIISLLDNNVIVYVLYNKVGIGVSIKLTIV